MIAKSDLIILVVSSTLLGVAIFRWDQNTRNVDTSTVLANTTAAAPSNTDSTGQALNTTALDTQADANATSATPTVIEIEPVVVETVNIYSTYTIQSGDSLSKIAARYNTTVSELQSINGIDGSAIFVGQEIQYPNN